MLIRPNTLISPHTPSHNLSQSLIHKSSQSLTPSHKSSQTLTHSHKSSHIPLYLTLFYSIHQLGLVSHLRLTHTISYIPHPHIPLLSYLILLHPSNRTHIASLTGDCPMVLLFTNVQLMPKISSPYYTIIPILTEDINYHKGVMVLL